MFRGIGNGPFDDFMAGVSKGFFDHSHASLDGRMRFDEGIPVHDSDCQRPILESFDVVGTPW